MRENIENSHNNTMGACEKFVIYRYFKQNVLHITTYINTKA